MLSENVTDMLNLAYIPDVLKRTVQTLTEFDPNWTLPEGYFIKEPKTASINLPSPSGTMFSG